MPSLTKDDVQASYFKASNRYADLKLTERGCRRLKAPRAEDL